jgi:signal transduction histidine kinase
MLRVSIASEESERKRIAQELHDDVSNQLVLIRRRMESGQASFSDLKTDVDTAISRVREISKDLLPPGIERFGLCAALEDYLQKVSESTDLQLNIDFQTDAQPNDRSRHLSIFRIVQELLGNTLKYAEAENVRITIFKQEEEGILVYEDDGLGFDVESSLRNNSLGLKNIASRAEVLDGSYKLWSGPGKGMKLELKWQI